jgi:type IV secretory pathway protease TraF
VGGNRVTIDAQGVRVNGVLLKNSAPRSADEAGRPLRAHELSNYKLGNEEVLLMSDYNPESFDGAILGLSLEQQSSR